ncbi:hypothetical protein BDL97_09G111100 [Sphagnum fallax]|nr:hypothetical protein BDL97_09G111100 [Sphagnum fallax]
MEEKEENFVLPSMVQGKQQLQAMLHRQWLFKRRGWGQTTMEIISPLLMMLLLIWGWSLSMEDHFKDQVFVDTTIPILASFKNQFSLNSKSSNFLQLCPPSSKLTHHQQVSKEELAIMSLLMKEEKALKNWEAMISSLNLTHNHTIASLWHFKAFSPLFLALSLSCIDSTTKMSATIHAFNKYFGPLLVPTFDEFVQLGNLIELGRITFAPNSTEVVALVDHLMTSTKFFKEVYGGTFLSEEEAVRDALTIANVDNPIWAIVVVNHLDLFNGKIEYKIRMNFTTTPPTTDTIHRRRKGVLTYYKQYYTSGFLSLQDVINTYIFSLVPNPSEATTALYEKPMWSAPFPTPAYIRNRYYETVGPILGLMMCLTTLYPLGMLVKALVEEKENRAKETMLIMGLKPWVFTMSWLITYLVVFFLISLMVTALLSFTVFPRSDPSILFLLFFLFTLSLIPFGFFLSVFFSKAKLAAIVAPFVHFTAILPRYIFFQTSHAQAILGKSATSLLPPSAYTFGVDLVALYEGAGYGLRWVNIMEDAFSMAWILFLLLVDSIVYAGLAWYLEQVLPSEYGAVQPAWFLFAPSYWQGGVLGVAAGPSASYEMVTMVQEEIEEPYLSTDGQLPAVHIEKLRKVFVGGKIAVDELTLDLFEGHITALLGHNGAGKSTTMSMLTGLIRPTSGDAKIWGHSIQDNMQNIRRIIGVCPQQNVLFGYLTVKEHLELYASLKGVPKLQTEQTVNEMVINLGLEDKANSRASYLSGGMQRKLQVGLAMIGGSRVVFLDEPTSGLDPQSRRSIWELLHSFKSWRAIVLTTHYMDEADLLCDRIAIMSEGRLQCCGSSLFLKAKFGVGYNLRMIRSSAACCSDSAIADLVLHHVPQAQVPLSFPHAGARGGGGLTFQLPLSNKGEFAQLFHELETRLEELHIGNYGISMTTMEDVFLRLSNKDHHDLYRSVGSSSCMLPCNNQQQQEEMMPFSLIETQAPPPSFDSESHASITSSSQNPSSHATAVHFKSHQEQDHGLSAGRTHRATQKTLAHDATVNDDDVHAVEMSSYKTQSPSKKQQHTSSSFGRAFGQIFKKRMLIARRDIKGLVNSILLPVMAIALVMLILKLNIDPAGPPLNLSFEIYSLLPPEGVGNSKEVIIPHNTIIPVAGAAPPEFVSVLGGSQFIKGKRHDGINNSLQLSQWLLNTFWHTPAYYGALVFNDTLWPRFDTSTISSLKVTDVKRVFGKFTNLSGKINNTTSSRVNDHDDSNKMLCNLSFFQTKSGHGISAPITFLHNTTSDHTLPALFQELAQARLRVGLNNSMASMRIISHPLPITKNEALRLQTILTTLAALFVLIPLSYCAASFAVFVVQERSVKAKLLQMVSGASPYSYWIATYAWDMANFAATVGITMLVFVAYRDESYIGTWTKAGAAVSLLMAFGLSVIPLSYCYSFAFNNPANAQVAIAGIHFVTGFGMYVSSTLMSSLGNNTKELNDQLTPIYQLFPPFNLASGLGNLAALDLKTELKGNGNANPYKWDVLGQSLVLMIGQAVAFLLLTLLIENGALLSLYHLLMLYASSPMTIFTQQSGVTTVRDMKEDSNVRNERKRVEGGLAGEDTVIIQELRKVHPGGGLEKDHLAVKGLSLGIPPGECFGFLGVNGAGKTTTLSILSGDLAPTSGDVFINGYSIISERSAAQKQMGYCPQFNPLLDLMTAREHLHMYASLKGVPADNVEDVVYDLLQATGLQENADQITQSYSGGNKRKLALAIAMVGDPAVVFLDEPSSGMDPLTRRAMWNLITNAVIKKNMSVVLTTHNMEECEALCNRIGIMVAGSLVCLGSIQQIKSCFGSGYTVELRCKSPKSLQSLHQFMILKFPESTLEEQHMTRVKYHLPKKAFSLSKAFCALEREKDRLGIEDYSISQNTLEQIFLRLANGHNGDLTDNQ